MAFDVVHVVLYALAIYLALGLVVGVPFVIAGIGRVDPAAKSVPAAFRVLVLPGVIAMWPWMLSRWMKARRLP